MGISGCGNSQTKKKQLREYSFYSGNPETAEIDLFNTTVGIMVQSKTGVRLNMEYIKSDDPATEAVYMISTGEYPDIIAGYTATMEFVNAGALIPLNDLIEQYGPNIKKYYGKTLELFKDEKGKIYYIGINYWIPAGNYPNSGFRLPIKLLKENNYPEVRHFDQYIELITQYVEKHQKDNPSLIGFTALTSDPVRNTLLPAAAFLMGHSHFEDIYFSDMNQLKARLIVQSVFAQKYFKTLNRLWNDGLLDRELFSQSEESYYNKIVQGNVIGFFDHINPVFEVIEAVERRGSVEDIPIPFPIHFEGVEGSAYNYIKVSSKAGVGISVSCKDPEGVMRFWNRFLEEDIQILIHWGVEKVHYYINKKGKMTKSPGQFMNLYTPEEGTMRFFYGFPQWDHFNYFSDGSIIAPDRHPGYVKTVTPKYLKNFLKEYGISSIMEWYPPPRKNPMGSAEILIPPEHPAEKIREELNRLTTGYLEQMITGKVEEFDGLWQRFQEAIEKVDVAAYLEYKTHYYRQRKKLLE